MIKADFSPGWLGRLLGFLPFIGTPVKRYFKRYESAQAIIDSVVRSLQDGAATLERDNKTLAMDQDSLAETGGRLRRAIALGRAVDDQLSYRLEREIEPGSPRYKLVAEELIFPLRQRIQDLQQHQAVVQQGVLSTELIMRNNKELMRGVNRAIIVTVNALRTAVTLSLALANQRIVLDKVGAVNDTTNRLIAGAANKLRTQGVEIHKQATSTQLDMDVLKQAFTDIREAMDDISRFRTHALPGMAETVLELDRLSAEQQQVLDRMARGNETAPLIDIEA